jgi:hypothetical protein
MKKPKRSTMRLEDILRRLIVTTNKRKDMVAAMVLTARSRQARTIARSYLRHMNVTLIALMVWEHNVNPSEKRIQIKRGRAPQSRINVAREMCCGFLNFSSIVT